MKAANPSTKHWFSWRPTLILAALLAIISGVVLWRVVATPRSLTALSGSPSSLTSNGAHVNTPITRGIYQFVGSQSSANATRPYVAGALLNYYWSQIEPTRGAFQWNLIDTDMQPWVKAGKHVILRITVSGNCYSNQPGSCSRTPDWVYADGVRQVRDASSGAVYPVFWDTAFQRDFQAFVQQFAARYDTDPSVTYIDAAVGNDGETIISKNAKNQAYALWQPYGYTDTLWLETIQKMLGVYANSFHTRALAVQVDSTFIQPKSAKSAGGVLNESAVLQAVIQLHQRYANFMFQSDSLNPNQSLGGVWQQIPLAVEQGQPAGDSTTLQKELQAAENERASSVLVFSSDINNAANQTVLQSAAQTLGN